MGFLRLKIDNVDAPENILKDITYIKVVDRAIDPDLFEIHMKKWSYVPR